MESKKINQLNFDGLGANCGIREKNFCVIAFYKNEQEKQKITKTLESIMPKYRDDPVIFYRASENDLNKKCILGTDEGSYFILRTKRGKFEFMGDNLTP